MSLLKVEVTGLDSLDKDFEKHKKAIKKQIPTALGIVGAEMVNDLQAIIEGYFYKSYSPKHYRILRKINNCKSRKHQRLQKNLCKSHYC